MKPVTFGPDMQLPGAGNCPVCRKKLDGATVINPGGSKTTPLEGDFSVCIYCGAHLRFESNLQMREATADDLRELHDRQPHTFDLLLRTALASRMCIRLHAFMQGLMTRLLFEAGYISGSELELRIMKDWAPKPDVAAALRPNLSRPYPTEQNEIEVVVEIKSPNDTYEWYRFKGRLYAEVGVARMFLVDPVKKEIWLWREGDLKAVTNMELPNHELILASNIWAALDQAVERGKP